VAVIVAPITVVPIFGIALTVTVCVAVAVFPLPSVTVHVIVVLPIGKILGALLFTLTTVQLSAVLGIPNTIAEPLHTDTFAGAAIVGLVLSTTVTICVAVAVFPLPSVTVHVTVVFPIGKELGALLLTLATEQLSAVDGEPKFTLIASHKVFVPTFTFAGAIIVGLITSEPVTVTI
jgi:hypothetical protein